MRLQDGSERNLENWTQRGHMQLVLVTPQGSLLGPPDEPLEPRIVRRKEGAQPRRRGLVRAGGVRGAVRVRGVADVSAVLHQQLRGMME